MRDFWTDVADSLNTGERIIQAGDTFQVVGKVNSLRDDLRRYGLRVG
jgi:hypothetical protein